MATKAIPEQQFEALPLRLAYPFLDANGLGTEAAAIRTSREPFGKYGPSTVKRAKVVALLRVKGLLEKFIDASWHFALTTEGKKKLERYERIYKEYQAGGASVDEAQQEDEEAEGGSEFALEEHLRDYLSRNLGILEQGLVLWPGLQSDEDAVEFPVDDIGPSRRIDILAKDRDGIPVVVELKVSRRHERTIGQALYYRARVKKLFNSPRVRIFIVAAEISPELRAAASEISDVCLYEYSLSMKLTSIAP